MRLTDIFRIAGSHALGMHIKTRSIGARLHIAPFVPMKTGNGSVNEAIVI